MTAILYVIENSYFGGGERSFAQLITRMPKQDYVIYVACGLNRTFTELISGQATVLPFSFRGLSSIFAAAGLAEIMRKNKIQIVHSQGGRADFFARLAAKKAGVKSISTIAMPVEGYDVGWIKKFVYCLLDRYSERFAAGFITVTEGLRRQLIEKHGIVPEKITVISNGIEADFTPQTQSLSQAVRQELGIKPETKIVGTVGRLVWQKGFRYLLAAAQQVLSTYDDEVLFLIVGEGPLRKNLEKQACALGIQQTVRFLGFRTDIPAIVSCFDVFVLPSLREGQPLALLEAMSMCVPVVATALEGIGDIVRDRVTGMLIPAKDAKALAEAIQFLLRDQQQARLMAQAAAELIRERFGLERMLEDTEQLYRGLLSRIPEVAR